jgi:hypothetical protein
MFCVTLAVFALNTQALAQQQPSTAVPVGVERKPIAKAGDFVGRVEAVNDALVELVRNHCGAYFAKEVKPHWPDAWIDYSKTRVGYEIQTNKHFYLYNPPRNIDIISAEIGALEREIVKMLGVAA